MTKDVGRSPDGSGSRASHEAAISVASSPEASIPNAGDWCVIGRTGSRGMMFAAANIERVTAKTVYANAHYLKQHPIENVIVMPDEESAQNFVARSSSAYAEAVRRDRAAWDYYRTTIGKLVASAIEARSDATPKSGAAEGEGAGPKDIAQ